MKHLEKSEAGKKKTTEYQWAVGQFQVTQNTCTWSPENRELEQKKIFEEILGENFQICWQLLAQISNPKLKNMKKTTRHIIIAQNKKLRKIKEEIRKHLKTNANGTQLSKICGMQEK